MGRLIIIFFFIFYLHPCHNSFLSSSQLHFLFLKKNTEIVPFWTALFSFFLVHAEERKKKILNCFSCSLSLPRLDHSPNTTHTLAYPTTINATHASLACHCDEEKNGHHALQRLGPLHRSRPTPPCPASWWGRVGWSSLPLPINSKAEKRN